VNLRRGDGRALRVGHRGAAALAPENTLAALRAAVEHGMDAVEFDVLADVDDRLVLAHSTLELPHERATLDEALAYLASTGVAAHLDLKQRGLEQRIADALRNHGLVERSFVSSLDHRALRDVRRHEPRLQVGLSYPEDRFGVARYRVAAPAIRVGLAGLRRTLPRLIGRWLDRAGAAAAVLHYALVTPRVIQRCHQVGAAVWAWTVNDPKTAAQLEDWGADAIITDDPRIFGDRVA
jgi:glycerophosphoryl diester phosphodiesterase